VNDSRRFLLEYFDSICISPFHIYHSALPLCPTSSWFHEYYGAELSQEVNVVTKLSVKWGACSHTIFSPASASAHARWKDIIAVGLEMGDINILNAITGVSISVLSGHTTYTRALAFASDGTLLVSGSDDETIKLWDIQTGGVSKTFYGHTDWIFSVSISPDHVMIASGSLDRTIRLWSAQTGECCCIIDGQDIIDSVSFSPTNSQLLISASQNNTIRQWDVNGHQVGPTYEGRSVAFSSDGTYFVSGGESVVTIHHSDSGVVISKLIAKLEASNDHIRYCCFSSDNKFVAGSDTHTIYIWDITKPDPCPIGTFVGHTAHISSLTFSPSVVSSSYDGSIKFWEIASLMAPVETDLESLPIAPAAVVSVVLQETDGVVITVDSAGVVKAWDLLTGHCTALFQFNPSEGSVSSMWLVDGKLIIAWHEYVVEYEDGKPNYHTYILDTRQEESHKTAITSSYMKLEISGDGSKVFLLNEKSIKAQSIATGEVMSKVEWLAGEHLNYLTVDGSKVGILFEDSQIHWWDFETTGSNPISLPSTSVDKPHLYLVWAATVGSLSVRNTVTGDEVFQLPGAYRYPCDVKLGGWYLAAGYQSGEVLMLDFNHLLLQ